MPSYDDVEAQTSPLTSISVRRNACFSSICKPIVNASIVVIYFAIGCAVYMHYEGWNLTDAIYFQMVTVSTVGYGDFSPSTDAMRVFTVFWILIGIIVVFTQLAKAVNFFTLPIVHTVQRFFDCVCKPKGIDIDGDGTADFHVPEHPLIYYPKQLFAPILIAAIVQVAAASAFMEVEGWTFGLAFYHCMVTATTVGYGDVSITTERGRSVAIVHILTSVAVIAMLISEMDDAAARRRKALEKLRLIRAKLDKEMLLSLDRDGTGVDKFEFVIGMIVKLRMLDWDEVEPFIKQFDALDIDKSGKLDRADLERAAELTADRIGRDRAATLRADTPRLSSGIMGAVGLATGFGRSSFSAFNDASVTPGQQPPGAPPTPGRLPTWASGSANVEVGKNSKGKKKLGKASAKAKAPKEVTPEWRAGSDFQMASASI